MSPARKDTGFGTGKSYSFQIDEVEKMRVCYGNGNHKSSGSRLEQLEEMQRSVEHFYMGQNHVLQ